MAWENLILCFELPFKADDPQLGEHFAKGALPTATRSINNSCANVDGGGWEVVSHSLTPIVGRQAILMTVIVRRPKK